MAEGGERPGFLGRWARRKNEVLQGKVPADPVAPLAPAHSQPVQAASSVSASLQAARPDDGAVALHPSSPDVQPPEAALTLDDVRALTQDSDFKPFMARGVGSDVRNAAVKKLFTDPHYNIMDGLDIYIDDYSIADPIPESMLRQMAGAKFLNLFDDGGKDAADNDSAVKAETQEFMAPTGEGASTANEAQDIASADNAGLTPPDSPSHPARLPAAAASQDDHAHPDLRLQPDNAPSARRAGDGAS